MIKNHLKIGLLSILICTLASCNQNKESKSQKIDQTVEKTGDEESKIGFSIPFPDGGEMITDNRTGETGSITLLYDADKYEEILKFYADYASGGDWNYNEFGQGERKSISYLSLQKAQTIAISPHDASSGSKIMVTLTAG